jgi:glycosyltransferase involved in cell wall biosynthesis
MTRTVVVAHPSPDLYGSDLQLVESVAGLTEQGWRVVVCLPSDGPLIELLEQHGADVEVVEFPVLRKAFLSPVGIARLAFDGLRALARLRRLITRHRPSAIYVNTLTIPVWLAAARLTRTPALCHVHEAEEDQHRLVRIALAAPLMLARTIVVNSQAAERALCSAIARLGARSRVVYNGVAGPPETPAPADPAAGSARLALVGRLSPRKGTDIALEAVSLLNRAGRAVHIDVCGSTFSGYEWYERELRERAERDDLRGSVHWAGYVSPTWPVLAAAHIVLVPSRAEPFGNAAVEAQLARRPVIASDIQGLTEIIQSEHSGLLVPADDPRALAEAIGRLLDDPALAGRLADNGRAQAVARFSVERYRTEIADAVTVIASGRRA